jgi:hypothetical protein
MNWLFIVSILLNIIALYIFVDAWLIPAIKQIKKEEKEMENWGTYDG